MFSLYVIQFRGYSWDVPKNGEENRYGGLAQLGERLPCKQEVSGSIPLISTKKRSEADMGQQLSWLEHTTDNREVDGSSPFWPTTSFKKLTEVPLQEGTSLSFLETQMHLEN